MSKAPDLTIRVGVHDVHLVRLSLAGNGAVTLSNDQFAAHAVNSADKRGELVSLQDLAGGAINHVDLAVLGAGEELAFSETESTDEALMHIHCLLARATIVATPDVDLAVGATGVADTIVIPSSASERGLLVSAEETLLLVAALVGSVPEVHVFDTGS